MNDIVTGVRELPHGVIVTVNGGEALRLTRKDCKSFPLREGDAVDLQKLKHDLLLSQYPAALNRAVRLLAVRARSGFEIEQRLKDACYLPDTVEMVLAKLQSNGLLDDLAFARQWAKEKTARQTGKARILYELRQKGVAAALIEQALNELDADAQGESAGRLAAKLIRRYGGDAPADARRKTIQALQRRGYTYGEALRALDEAQGGADGSEAL